MANDKLKQIINECIEEMRLEEGWGGFLSGGLAGFITGWAMKNKPKTTDRKDVDKIASAALNFESSVHELRDALSPLAGNTTGEKFDTFLEQLKNTSFDNLKPLRKRRRK